MSVDGGPERRLHCRRGLRRLISLAKMGHMSRFVLVVCVPLFVPRKIDKVVDIPRGLLRSAVEKQGSRRRRSESGEMASFDMEKKTSRMTRGWLTQTGQGCGDETSDWEMVVVFGRKPLRFRLGVGNFDFQLGEAPRQKERRGRPGHPRRGRTVFVQPYWPLAMHCFPLARRRFSHWTAGEEADATDESHYQAGPTPAPARTPEVGTYLTFTQALQ